MINSDRRHSIAGAFVFLLLGVFALFSMLLVLLGTQAYRAAVEQTAAHGRARILQTFVRNAVRADDVLGVIEVRQIDALPVLAFAGEADGERYEKTIYCYDGALRERYASADYPFSPEEGEMICEAASFEPKLKDGLLDVTLTDTDGRVYKISIAQRCGG